MTDAPVRFLVLSRAPVSGYPVTIKVHAAGVRTRLNISKDGPPVISVGGQFPVLRVVGTDGELHGFQDEFDAAQAQWLVPYLARLADGEEVTEAELTAAYAERFGVEPVVELLPITV